MRFCTGSSGVRAALLGVDSPRFFLRAVCRALSLRRHRPDGQSPRAATDTTRVRSTHCEKKSWIVRCFLAVVLVLVVDGAGAGGVAVAVVALAPPPPPPPDAHQHRDAPANLCRVPVLCVASRRRVPSPSAILCRATPRSVVVGRFVCLWAFPARFPFFWRAASLDSTMKSTLSFIIRGIKTLFEQNHENNNSSCIYKER
jgi:hypothetical protein